MEGIDLIKNFINRSDEEKAAIKKEFDSAQDTGGGSPVGISGKYRMRVSTRCYPNKKTGEWTIFPTVVTASQKGSLMLNMLMEVVDGTAEVPAGSTAFHAITIMPKPGSDNKLIQSTFGMCKPQLIALLGTKEGIDLLDMKWITTNLLPEFKIENDKATMIHDHQLKHEVMVTIVDTVNPNTGKAEVRTKGMVMPAGINDHSVSNKPMGGATSAGFEHLDTAGVTGDAQREDF